MPGTSPGMTNIECSLRRAGRGRLGRGQHLPMRRQLQFGFGQRLQLLERHARNHLDHRQALRRHIDHREVGVDTLDAIGRG